MQNLWKCIKALVGFIGLGLTAAAVCARIKLRRVDAAGHRIQGHLDELGRGVEDIQTGVSEALNDNRKLTETIGSAVSGIKGDLGEAGEIARRLQSADRRAESTLERLEEANRRFAELVGKTASDQ